MALDLYKHNLDAYNNAIAMLAETGKAAVIHPTGTGKSFIGFKLCEDNPDKTICWLSPSDYIFKTQLENLAEVSGGWQPENIKFFTYAKLMNMSQSEIDEIKPYAVVIDEYHRAGAVGWSKGIETLLKLNPNVLMLGLSATNIRYLDNQRDMADELFDGNIASEMTLGEAIVRGILNAPKYVLSVFSYEKELEKYEKSVSRINNTTMREVADEYLNALRRTIENADGLDEIFSKHMENRTGKYIVFCSCYDTMTECMGYVSKWFGKVDKEPKVYSVYSGDAGSSKSFSDFVNDNDDSHLRLLFCIDALNEGIHIDDISGVVLFRPTISPIVYKQQIGRTLSANKKTTPVIFDVVNNIENLYSIDGIRDEMEAAITYYRYNGNGEEIVTDHFTVIDEVADCRQLFDELEGVLSRSWDYMYEEAKKYYEEHGSLVFPRSYYMNSGSSLMNWVALQRNIRNGTMRGELTERQIELLDEIGMRWENKADISWNKNFSAYKEYVENGGSLKVSCDFVYNGVELGKWLQLIRKYHKSGIRTEYFTSEREKALEQVGMVWDQIDFVWEQNYSAALDYYRIHGDLEVPHGTTWNGVKLGLWLSELRKADRKLTDEQIKRLDAIGMRWKSKADLAWERGYEEAKKYSEEHGAADASFHYVTSDGYKLGVFLSKCREKYAKGTLSQDKIDMLNEIGMVWNKSRANDWESCFRLLEKYYREHGDLNISPTYVEDGVWLNKWLNEQIHIYKGKRKGKSLSEEQLNKLRSVGFKGMTITEERWEANYKAVKAFYDEHGHCKVPVSMKLNTWISNQKKLYKAGRMSFDRIEKLRAVGIILE